MSGDGYGSERPVGTFTQWVENRNADDQLVKSLEEAFEKEGEKQNDVPPEPEKPEDSKKDPPKDTPSARVQAVLQANKERQKSSADVLRQALLALGPPGKLPQDVRMQELANLHAQVHAGEVKDSKALSASEKGPADRYEKPVAPKTSDSAAPVPPVTQPPVGPAGPVPSLGGTTLPKHLRMQQLWIRSPQQHLRKHLHLWKHRLQ